MSDRMTPIPFGNLMNWILEEQKTGSVFGVKRPYRVEKAKNWEIFGRKMETPFGPAAGPHTQLAQNIVASYYAGSRFFELKTVQKLDGEDLPVAKPCIKADDECYNVEWSTELYVPQAFDEYVKAWFALKVMAKEFDLGSEDGFVFNMSVGYDLEGIQTPKVDGFLEGMKDASHTPIFQECKAWLLEHVDAFAKVTREDIEAISPEVCNCVTLSTLHGCPPQEIERIARYLLEEKKVHTFIKCNPTLLGYPYARAIMDEMGYDYVAFGEFHFKDDLQYEDAVPMLERLQALADACHLEFGVKITNTFPVDIKAGELPGEEMYMSGKSLYPLSMSVAAKLSKDFGGKLRISYSGGADSFNIEEIVRAGIWPVTMATTLLKPGGYQRLEQIGELFAKTEAYQTVFAGVDAEKVKALVEAVKTDKHHVKAVKPLPSRKMKKEVPLLDCFTAPCKEGCPIHQDITTYTKLVGEGKYEEAFGVIVEKNPLPFITGTICPHNCMSKCSRNFYDSPVNIRRSKLEAAEGGYEAWMQKAQTPTDKKGKKVAVVGGGPAGLAAAYFLARGNADVTIFEKEEKLGGVVGQVIPDFRIRNAAIEKDLALILAMGVKVQTGVEVQSVAELKKEYDAVVLAVGAKDAGLLHLEEGEAINALNFLREWKKEQGKLDIGSQVVVIGGGNTAMDTARAAKRTQGVEKVSLVYRRTRRYMPADEEELLMAIADGVEFAELLAPLAHRDGKLLCRKMQLGEPDASGRRGVVETEETVEIAADTVIAAIGEKIPKGFYEENGLFCDERGRVRVHPETLESSVEDVYVAGDGLYGPATVVEAIRDGRKAAEGILGKTLARDFDALAEEGEIYAKRGRLVEESEAAEEKRCLGCDVVCENCVEACPNRANIAIRVAGRKMHQIIHVDYMCNECGNCKSFCPYASAPYLDKFTLFANEADMENSKNQGFVLLNPKEKLCKIRLGTKELLHTVGCRQEAVPEGIDQLIAAVIEDYGYLFRY